MTAKTKLIAFLASVIGASALAFGPLLRLVETGRPADYYTHIPLVPVVCAFVFFRRWPRLPKEDKKSPLLGGILLVLAAVLFLLDWSRSPGLVTHVEFRTAASILLLWGSFLALYGKRAFGKALFPLLFLTFLVPLPLTWMDRIVSALVVTSVGFTHMLFQVLRVPFVQEGAVFLLPGSDIEVAQACSGIRSSLALLITGILSAQIFLKGPLRKMLLVMSVFPVAVLKNGVRILTLYLLSYFIDMKIIERGFLHRSGGFLFFGLGLIILANILWFLGGLRKRAGEPRPEGKS